jgi:tRNA A37 methylthiotransferase MiaB
MKDTVSPELKNDRHQRLTEVEADLRHTYFKSLIGKRLQVLIEGENSLGAKLGTSCRYAPVEISNSAAKISTLTNVTIQEAHPDVVLGTDP